VARIRGAGGCVGLAIVSIVLVVAPSPELCMSHGGSKKKAEKSSGKRRHLISLDIVRVGFLMLPYAQPLARPLPPFFYFAKLKELEQRQQA